MKLENILDYNNIDERVVTFGKQAFPRSRQVVYMAGGPGVGKSYVIRNIIPIDAKTINVDVALEAITTLMSYAGKKGANLVRKILGDDEIADEIEAKGKDALKDSDLLFSIYKIINAKYDKTTKLVVNLIQSKYKPNILIDGTGKSLHKEKTTKMLDLFKANGYQTTLVYVYSNRDIAWQRNLGRSRVVPEEVFNKIHDAVDSSVKMASKHFDNVWYVDTSLDGKEYPRWWITHPETVLKVK